MKGILRFFEGILVGVGAIMPGISGGTLCVVFGMYEPLIEVLSHPITGLKKHFKMLFMFVLGGAVGFVGLSGLASKLLETNSQLATCAFIGFILGTFPELWQDAGKKGRTASSYISLFGGFVFLLLLLQLLSGQSSLVIEPGIFGYLLCGILWGLSFIVPGLSSSTLLLFLGLYQPMLEGISKLSLSVLLPLGIGAAACVLLLSKAIHLAFRKCASVLSHAILGLVAATTVMIFLRLNLSKSILFPSLLLMAGGALISYLLTRICAKLEVSSEKAVK